MGKLSVKVLHKRQEAEDIISLELGRADGGSLPAFSAGSYIDVYVKPDLIRQYSLCNHPEERHRYLIGVLRDPASRGGSVAIHDEIHEGKVVSIPPGQSITTVLKRRGIDIDVACQRGVCGTCVTHILEGEPEHRDHYLSTSEKAENNQFTPCCSRAKSQRLVLDL